MYKIGLTGGIGSGKSRVADMLAEWGASVIDADEISHALTAPGGAAMPAIAREFGPQAVAADGALDRAWMRDLVFREPTARGRLEALLHPLIGLHTEQAAAQARGLYLVFVVPCWSNPAAGAPGRPHLRGRLRPGHADRPGAETQWADGAGHQAYHGGTGCAGNPAGGRGRRHRQRWRHLARYLARAGKNSARPLARAGGRGQPARRQGGRYP